MESVCVRNITARREKLHWDRLANRSRWIECAAVQLAKARGLSPDDRYLSIIRL